MKDLKDLFIVLLEQLSKKACKSNRKGKNLCELLNAYFKVLEDYFFLGFVVGAANDEAGINNKTFSPKRGD